MIQGDRSTTLSEASMDFRVAFSYSLVSKQDLLSLPPLGVDIWNEVSRSLYLLSFDELEMAYSPRKWFNGAFPIIRRLISIAKEAPQEAIKLIQETCNLASGHPRDALEYIERQVPDLLSFVN
jgi:hypothetical protein